ncbi:unnamed protein product [Linum trigynum]|uniref:T-complex protein 11 n=1 Tax=Linum trigynum TaxID=586398 RepID=A0AAV2EII3_9ROSI
MATGVESSPLSSGTVEKVAPSGIALDFPATDAPASASPPRIPKRLRKRMMEAKTSPVSSVQEIEAKLRDAELRRQQFYEMLSTKARPKPRSPSRSSSQDEDLGQRLEAKLLAAEQKRLGILTNAQMRLAKLDELRQAVKAGVETRVERERQRLGTKVELRVQQAEENRMLLMKAYKQRHASVKERTSRSLMQRVAKESKYKERVRAAINQKRAAAEKKRLGLLEAEKKKACDRILQVQQVAKSVSYKREIERRRMMDQLEDRLQRAKRQRAEYLKQRCRQRSPVQMNLKRMEKQADVLSRKLARCWRKFLSSRRTTLELVKDYDALKINENSVKTMPFEQLASAIGSPATLRTVKALLDRLESRYKVCRAVAAASYSSTLDNIDHLLKRVTSPQRRSTPRSSMRSREAKSAGATRELTRSPAKLSRYSVRVALCAYMILGHPDAVLSSQGERETALAKSAKDFIHEFELLIRIILEGPLQSSDDESDSISSKRCTFRSQLVVFDKAWCAFLNCFVVWKVKDAVSLEEDLVRAACQLELSMIQKCKMSPGGENKDLLSHDMKAIQKQVTDDQKLLRDKVRHLSGDAGIERMQSALDKMRSKYKENGTPIGSPIISVSSPGMPCFVAGAATPASTSDVRAETPSRVVRSLFKDESIDPFKQASSSAAAIPPKSAISTAAGTSSSVGQVGGSVNKMITENEVIVNELLHEKGRGLVDRLDTAQKVEENLQAKIKEAMEKAFWDGVMNSVKEEGPDYDRVINLVKEVRDEIIEMAPESWRQTIMEAIDIDVLTQVLTSGNLDIEYLGKILEFALATLLKLSSPAHEDEMKVKYQNLLQELTVACQNRDDNAKSSPAVAMIRGLRFVLEQIQTLKSEISKARIKLMEPLLKGSAGLEYIRKAFANRHGSPLDACSSLPLTKQWLSSLISCSDQEWEEHNNSLSALASHENPSQAFLPSTALRTGGSFQVKQSAAPDAGSSNEQSALVPERPGDRIDLLVRLGLLKMVTEVSGITPETLPETFALNLSRLRGVQAEVQKLIVVTTSVLVCRQTLLMERGAASSADIENTVSNCSKQLLQLLDHGGDDAGIDEIVGILSSFFSQDSSPSGSENENTQQLQSRKEVMGRMLGRSLQAGDPVFTKVSRAIYSAARGVVLAGSGFKGRKLVETALRPVGATILADRVVEAAQVLVTAAGVSVAVHGPWYATLVNSL